MTLYLWCSNSVITVLVTEEGETDEWTDFISWLSLHEATWPELKSSKIWIKTIHHLLEVLHVCCFFFFLQKRISKQLLVWMLVFNFANSREQNWMILSRSSCAKAKTGINIPGWWLDRFQMRHKRGDAVLRWHGIADQFAILCPQESDPMQNQRLLVINDAVVFEFTRRFNFLLEVLFVEILLKIVWASVASQIHQMSVKLKTLIL